MLNNYWHLEDKSPELKENEISILSMNALADEFCLGNKRQGEDKNFDDYDDSILEWSFRVKILLDIIERNNSDFVCLQEVDAIHYENLDEEMKKKGYQSYFQKEKKNKNKVIGNVTFYKEEKYEMIHCESRSRIIITSFKTKKYLIAEKEFVINVCNCHLEAGDRQTEKRFTQVKSCFDILSRLNAGFPKKLQKEIISTVFIVGDLNSGDESGKKIKIKI
eukprot:TRINITY_DN2641_c0_g1_i4.p1 TRINITY_DN2641_c0_g1~~TRINITY_DN2641_c0_g1_i4.p1  ORF type:complete len:220 (-),score=63.00 TRINITY_DN2641_c0_g1_i4:226-885(-)